MALRHQVNINFILSRLDSEIERLNQTCNGILDSANQTNVENVDDKVTLLNVCLVEMANAVCEFLSTWHKYTNMYEEAADKDRDDFGLLQKISADQQRQAQQLNELIDVVNSLFVGDAENEDDAEGGILGFVNKLVESNNRNFAKIDSSLRQMNQLGPRIDACVGQIALKEYLQSDQYKNNRIGNKSAFKNIDTDLIVKMYKEGQSVGQIAKTFGVSGPTIAKRLKDKGVWVDRRCKDA